MEHNNVSIYSSVFRIGVVHSVDGRVVKVLVDKDKNISVDPTGKKSGRGAYVSLEPDKIAEAQKNQVLEKSLGVKVSADFYDDLYAYVDHQKARKELFGDK